MSIFSAMTLLLCTVCGSIILTPHEVASNDGAAMVFITMGPFVRGSAAGEGDADERPQRTVHLKAFWIDRHEVTNRQYRACARIS